MDSSVKEAEHAGTSWGSFTGTTDISTVATVCVMCFHSI